MIRRRARQSNLSKGDKMNKPLSDLLQQQIAYYRARAQEYDQWFYRQGYYDFGADFKQQWRQEVQTVREQLRSSAGQAHILEMACGTGIWTQELVQIGARVTALDASPEMIAINQAKLQSEKVTYQQTNLFQWQPQLQYDMVFFGFWLSHVPAEQLPSFLQTVHRALKPGGRLFFVDSRQIETASPRKRTIQVSENRESRALNDGRRFEIVKIYYDPRQLTETLRQRGFAIRVQATPSFFIYADGRKAE